MDVILDAVRLLCQILLIAIFIRIVISWVAPMSRNPFTEIIFTITEPLLAPIRNLLPRTGMFDFSPMIAMVILIIISYIAAVLR